MRSSCLDTYFRISFFCHAIGCYGDDPVRVSKTALDFHSHATRSRSNNLRMESEQVTKVDKSFIHMLTRKNKYGSKKYITASLAHLLASAEQTKRIGDMF